jgi:ribose transport system substrate-binding protein
VHTRTLRLISTLAMLSLALFIAACGSDDDSSSSSSSASGGSTTTAANSGGVSPEVKATVAKWSKKITEWPGPNTSVNPPAGKKITVITCGSTGITCVRVANGASAAAKALGYQVNVVDGKNDPAVWNSAVQQAVAQKADGIVLAAVPPAVIPKPVAAARKQGVEVASVLSNVGKGIPDILLDFNRNDTADATGAYLADYSEGKANVLLVRDPEFPAPEAYFDQIIKNLPQVCPDCKVEDTVKFSLALIAQRLAPGVANSLRTHPEIDTIMTPFDAVTPFVQQGIQQAGKKGKVKIIGEGADPPGVAAMKSGDMVQSMGTPAEWMGWQAVDGLVRLFAGKKVEEAPVPQRLVVATDPPGPEGWQGDFDYQSKYKEIWGK